jgi:hypothetical protein
MYLCFTVARLAVGPTELPIGWVLEALSGLKQPGQEADFSPPSITEVGL